MAVEPDVSETGAGTSTGSDSAAPASLGTSGGAGPSMMSTLAKEGRIPSL